MKTLLSTRFLPALLLAGVVACHSGAPTPASRPAATSNTPAGPAGAATARGAVEQFFTAVRAQDLQAMSLVWGTAKGPAHDNIERNELEKRTVILQCYFTHDAVSIGNEMAGEGGQRVFRVSIVRGKQTRTPAVYTVQGPGGRWYVQDLEIAAVRDFCSSSGQPTR